MSGMPAFVRHFKVAGFVVTVSLPPLERGEVSSAAIEWSPRAPRMDVEFTAAERTEYQRKLMDAIAAAGA